MLTRSDLHDYQLTAIEHMIENKRCALFLDMGLGKTVSTLTAIKYLMYEDFSVGRVLIIAPKRVAENVWINEVKEWEHLHKVRVSVITGTEKKRMQALKTPAEIYTISRDNIKWLCGLFGWSMLPFDMVVIDESSSFKNPSSQRFKALKKAMDNVERVVLLTGTPAPNTLKDLWPQIYLLDKGQRLGKSMREYTERYFRTINMGQFNKFELRKGSKELIYEQIKDIAISMKKDDYLDLKKPFFNYIKLQMDTKTKKAYEEFEKEQIMQLYNEDQETTTNIDVANAAALSNKLLQFANGAVYDENKEAHVVHNLKLEALQEVVDEANGKPVLVAYTFQSDMKRILEKFPDAVVLKTDQHISDWNAGKIPMLIMHPASGGHGLNIQKGGHIIVWFGNTWSLELYEQFNARLDRQGQTETVIIHHFLVEGTLDFDVIESIKKKAEGQNALMEAVKARKKKYLKSFLK